MRADFDQEKKRAVNVATRSLERDLERLKADHATEMEEMLEKNREEMSNIKKKQWVGLFMFVYTFYIFENMNFYFSFLDMLNVIILNFILVF